ncbi:hypothetical protein L914_08828 [Phytophthora nicotianae]|uniref:Uncharacterized protein n=1 Tax=Phytophthora nicotianae TaxID=4792 RepID=W2NCA1_PHYNI|nr:hypothetical protein L914_08828 [Phytophthora nicotianae]
MVTVDSEDNQRRRAASPSTNEVEWLTEGGMWAVYENEADAADLPIQWTQFVIRWEQVALPSNVFLEESNQWMRSINKKATETLF